MYWTLELASKLEDAPWPATKDELIDYAMRSGAPLEVIAVSYTHLDVYKRQIFIWVRPFIMFRLVLYISYLLNL